MMFDPEAIERLSPAARVEVQDYYARKYLARHERRVQERRTLQVAPAVEPQVVAAAPVVRTRWPRAVWFRNDSSRAGAGQSAARR